MDTVTASARAGGSDRGQVAFDFMVGMAVFLVTVGFVVTFVPGIFQPFDTSTGPNMVVADRAASHLVEDALVESPAEPGVLNSTCTAEFFDADGSVGACRFDADASDVNAALGVEATTSLNVTVSDNAGLQYAAGRPAPPTGDVVVARRVVLLDGTRQTLVVRVW